MGSLSKSVFQAEIQTQAVSSLEAVAPRVPGSLGGGRGGRAARTPSPEPKGSTASLHAVAALISTSPGVCPQGLSAQ